MEDIKNWSIERFHVERTYNGILEGSPKDERVKEICLRGAYQHVPKWIQENHSNEINFLNEETDDGYLKRFIITFNMVDMGEEKQAIFVVLVDEINNITETITTILENNPNFKTFEWGW